MHVKNSAKESLSTEMNQLISNFKLQAHPEGGYCVRTFQSNIEIKSNQ
jgi:predicted cupin superfamily sugar epimerase